MDVILPLEVRGNGSRAIRRQVMVLAQRYANADDLGAGFRGLRVGEWDHFGDPVTLVFEFEGATAFGAIKSARKFLQPLKDLVRKRRSELNSRRTIVSLAVETFRPPNVPAREWPAMAVPHLDALASARSLGPHFLEFSAAGDEAKFAFAAYRRDIDHAGAVDSLSKLVAGRPLPKASPDSEA